MGAKIGIPEIAHNHDCWGFMVLSRSAGHQDTLFLEKQIKIDEVTTPRPNARLENAYTI